MKYSSALQRLLDVLEEAEELNRKRESDLVAATDPTDFLGLASRPHRSPMVTMQMAMGLPENTEFGEYEVYTLVLDAINEARSIERIRNKPKYKKVLDQLKSLLISSKILDKSWSEFRKFIDQNQIEIALESLQDMYERDKTVLPLFEANLLEKINKNFQEILNEVINSDLSKELKNYFVEKLEELLKAIRRYQIDGSEGLKRITQEIISDTISIESKLKPEDRRNPVLKKLLTQVGVLNRMLGLTSAASIFGFAVDMETLLPRFTSYLENPETILSIEKSLSISEIIEESVLQFENYEQPALEGKKEPKALPPGNGDSEE